MILKYNFKVKQTAPSAPTRGRLTPKLLRHSNSLFLKVFILQKLLYKHMLYNVKIFIYFGYIDIKMED